MKRWSVDRTLMLNSLDVINEPGTSINNSESLINSLNCIIVDHNGKVISLVPIIKYFCNCSEIAQHTMTVSCTMTLHQTNGEIMGE